MSSERVAVPARIVRALGISINGLRTAVRLEEAFRLELLVLIFVIPAAWILTSVGIQRALLIGSWLLVMIVEIINSAIETVVDLIGTERSRFGRGVLLDLIGGNRVAGHFFLRVVGYL